jgi:hypothetical protein
MPYPVAINSEGLAKIMFTKTNITRERVFSAWDTFMSIHVN